ncbi:hypothetical protein [Candidatus Frankia nodulisporulans]|uniref:hypothetical protein n=1 Tax=Candidatus Frankia nodulisporulans TaxID=2060052 RepID=UPI0013D42A5B|nr:hypothetical protein [Candidatus Frankia nodulisporulans]
MPPYDEHAPHRQGLLDLALMSMAPTNPVERALRLHSKLNLSHEQITELLELATDYHLAREMTGLRFSAAGHLLRPTNPTPPSAIDASRLHLLRGDLLVEDETRASASVERVQEILGEETWTQLVQHYTQETTDLLTRLGPVLAAAVDPVYALVRRDTGVEVDPNDVTVADVLRFASGPREVPDDTDDRHSPRRRPELTGPV